MTRGGSTTAWRKLRLFVAGRDGLVCRRELCQCGNAPLTMAPGRPDTFTLGHIVDVIDGGTSRLDNLRPECARGNYAAGADQTNARKRLGRLNVSREW